MKVGGAGDTPALTLGEVGGDRGTGGVGVGHLEIEAGGDLGEHVGVADRPALFEQRVADGEIERLPGVGAVLVGEGGGTEDVDGARWEGGRVEAAEQVTSDLGPQVGDLVGDLARFERLAVYQLQRPGVDPEPDLSGAGLPAAFAEAPEAEVGEGARHVGVDVDAALGSCRLMRCPSCTMACWMCRG